MLLKTFKNGWPDLCDVGATGWLQYPSIVTTIYMQLEQSWFLIHPFPYALINRLKFKPLFETNRAFYMQIFTKALSCGPQMAQPSFLYSLISFFTPNPPFMLLIKTFPLWNTSIHSECGTISLPRHICIIYDYHSL